jgi:hypothetical protein
MLTTAPGIGLSLLLINRNDTFKFLVVAYPNEFGISFSSSGTGSLGLSFLQELINVAVIKKTSMRKGMIFFIATFFNITRQGAKVMPKTLYLCSTHD